MSHAERDIREVLHDLFATPEERDRFAADLRVHFDEGASRGESPRETIERLGKPVDVAAAFNAERKLAYAGFWRRVIAFIGDIGFLGWLNLPLLGGVLWAFPLRVEHADPPIWAWIVLGVMALAACGVVLCYFPVVEARFGKTVGKHLLRIRVLQESGAPIHWHQAFLRRLSFYFDLLAPDALFVPFTEKKQRALDIVAKTVVVTEPGPEAPWLNWALCLLMPLALCGLFCALAITWPAG